MVECAMHKKMSSSVRNEYWTYSHKGRRALLRDTFKWALQLILMMKIMIMKMIILMKVMKENDVLHALRAFRLRDLSLFPFLTEKCHPIPTHGQSPDPPFHMFG